MTAEVSTTTSHKRLTQQLSADECGHLLKAHTFDFG